MKSSNGNLFRVTGLLWGESTGHRWIPLTKPVTRSFEVFFDLRLNKRLSNQSRRRWFETPLRSLWGHMSAPNVVILIITLYEQSYKVKSGIAIIWDAWSIYTLYHGCPTMTVVRSWTKWFHLCEMSCLLGSGLLLWEMPSWHSLSNLKWYKYPFTKKEVMKASSTETSNNLYHSVM